MPSRVGSKPHPFYADVRSPFGMTPSFLSRQVTFWGEKAGSGKITGMTTTVTAMGTPFALSSNFSKPLDEEVDCVSKN